MRAGELIGLLTCALALQVAGPTVARDLPSTRLAAHRGGAALWPENSLLAFRSASALGVDYLELDVHLARDGAVVVIHDPTLDRTTTGTGPVKDRTLSELKSFRLKDRRHVVTDERIPSLDDVVAVAAAAGCGLLVEMKVDPSGARYPGIEERVFAVLDRHGMASSSVVMAFEPDAWRRVRELRPEARAGALYSARMLAPGAPVIRALDAARAAGVAHVGLEHGLVTADVVAHARAAGIWLGAWTVNEPDAIRRLLDQRIDILTTDRPDLGRALLLNERRTP